MKPLISIIIPTYNRLRYLQEALDSALSQDYENLEIIVVFDGGNKTYFKLITLKYQHQAKVKILYKENGGVSSALNLGIKVALGKFIVWLSDDDKMASNHLTSLYRRYINEPYYYGFKKTIVYSGWRLINKDNQNISDDIYPGERGYPLELMERCCLPLFRSLIHGCSMLIERSLFHVYGFFRDDLKTTQDYYLWFLFFTRCNLIYCHGSTLLSRLHENQTGNTLNKLHLFECNELWVYFIDNVFSIDEKLGFTEFNILMGFYEHLKHSSYRDAFEHLLMVAQDNLPVLTISCEYLHNSEGSLKLVDSLASMTYNEMFVWAVITADDKGNSWCENINGLDVQEIPNHGNAHQTIEYLMPHFAREYGKHFHCNNPDSAPNFFNMVLTNEIQ